MSYPQPSANEYAVSGSKFFRLNTLISSAGDIYESAQGAHAFALGPESDISKVNIVYFDAQVPDFVNQTSISPHRAFTGRIDARNDATYQPADRPGRILLYPDEIYDPNYRPTGFNALTDLMIFNTPQLDVIQFFTPQSGLQSTRNDKTFYAADVPILGIGGVTYIVLPYYGRRYAYCEVSNFSTGGPPPALTYGIIGVNFAITDDTGTARHQQTTLLAPAGVAGGGGQNTKIITATTNGMFDVLVFSFSGSGIVPQFKVIVSDSGGS